MAQEKIQELIIERDRLRAWIKAHADDQETSAEKLRQALELQRTATQIIERH